MSISLAREALAGAITSATPSAMLRGRFERVGERGDAPFEKLAPAKLRAFVFRTAGWPEDSGLAAARISQWQAVWEIWTAYPCHPTDDRERLHTAIAEDLQIQAQAVIPPTVWLPHLEVCAPGAPRVEEVIGAHGFAVALLGVLALNVLYRS